MNKQALVTAAYMAWMVLQLPYYLDNSHERVENTFQGATNLQMKKFATLMFTLGQCIRRKYGWKLIGSNYLVVTHGVGSPDNTNEMDPTIEVAKNDQKIESFCLKLREPC